MYLLPWNDDMNGVLLIALLWEVNKHVLSLRLAGTQVDSLLFFQYYSVHCLHIAFNRCLSRRARRIIVAISLPSHCDHHLRLSISMLASLASTDNYSRIKAILNDSNIS